MLEKLELHRLYAHLSTPSAGQSLIECARREAPIRKVQSSGRNVVTICASAKMGREIRTESRHLEAATVIQLELCQNVLEYYPQPCEVKSEFIDEATGEIHRIQHTPDFLVIYTDSLCIIECKSQAKLKRLSQKYPWRYKQDSDGQWYAPPLESYFAQRGIRYVLWTEHTLNPLRTENLLHLADYLLPSTPECSEEVLQEIHTVLQEHGYVYVSELLQPPYSFQSDDINKAIADGLLITDLNTQHLTKPARCMLFRDATLMQFVLADTSTQMHRQECFELRLEPGDTFHYEGQLLTLNMVGHNEVIVTSQDGRTHSLSQGWLQTSWTSGKIKAHSCSTATNHNFSQYSQTQLQQALARKQQLERSSPVVSERTLRRWKQQQSRVKAGGGHPLLALVPQSSARGNRTARLSEAQADALSHIIQAHWLTSEAKNYRTCYRQLQVYCGERGITSPSYSTLIAAIKARQSNRDVRTRHCKRMAYQQDVFVDVLYADTPQHGSRPFQYVHIDHTQLDIELINSRTGHGLGRPWLSLAIDAYSRRVLAMYLTYDPPSYTSVMMCIRSMVKRYQRLPEFVVVDNGKDLVSSAFSTFLTAMGVHLRMRPAGQPRHGAVLERLFGRLNTEYIHNLAGNTKATKNVRMTTGKHLPRNLAQWTLESLYYGLQHWAYEYYEHQVHPALDMSPHDAYERGLAETGKRHQRLLAFNSDFLISTCPPVDRGGNRKVDPQRGVKVNDLRYWNPIFSNAAVAGKSCLVRYDPWDASSVYVQVADKWIHARCRSLQELGQLSEEERLALTQEYHHRNGRKLDAHESSQRLKEFMRTFRPEGALALALEKQQENKQLYGALELASVFKDVTHSPKSLTRSFTLSSRSAGKKASPQQPDTNLPIIDTTTDALCGDADSFEIY